MATQPKIIANQQNALKSTGPRTDEGKAVSSQNAFKHGLYAKGFFVRPDEQEAFAELRDSLLEEFAPQTALARHLFSQILHAAWRIWRADQLELALFENHAEPLADDASRQQFDLIARYRARAERSYYRALGAFRDHATDLFNKRSFPALIQQDMPDLAHTGKVHTAFRNHYALWRNVTDGPEFNYPNFPPVGQREWEKFAERCKHPDPNMRPRF